MALKLNLILFNFNRFSPIGNKNTILLIKEKYFSFSWLIFHWKLLYNRYKIELSSSNDRMDRKAEPLGIVCKSAREISYFLAQKRPIVKKPCIRQNIFTIITPCKLLLSSVLSSLYFFFLKWKLYHIGLLCSDVCEYFYRREMLNNI